MKTGLTRRTVIERGGWLGAGALVAPALSAFAAEEKSRVVLVRDPFAVTAEGVVNGDALAGMLDAAVVALVGGDGPAAAWRQIVRPADVVGIKSNVWRNLPTPPALEAAITRRVVEAGVAERAVAVDDRGILANPVFKEATALINVRPLRTHHWAGLGTCLKNYIMFVPDPWSYHDNACERLGAVWRLPHVVGRTRLNVLVMLTPLFHGTGPHHFNRAYTWPYGGLVVSRDPVAADAVGAAIITAQRRAHFGEDRPIQPPPHHIEAAERLFHLGTARLDRIELIRLGEPRDSLI
jgi:hypothetical protein